MIKVYEENGTYDIDVYANEKEEERNNSIMGLTIDTKRHMYYVVLPEESFRSEPEKVIVDSIKLDILKKNYISEIAKDPRNVSLSGETKVYVLTSFKLRLRRCLLKSFLNFKSPLYSPFFRPNEGKVPTKL